MCRMSAVNLASLAPIISARGGRIVGIAPGAEEYEGFLQETKWQHDLLVDESREAYQTLNMKKNGCKECWGFCICCNSVGKWFGDAKKKGYSNVLKGNLTQYGGTLLVRCGQQGRVIFGHKQTAKDFEPNVDAILDKLHATDQEKASRRPYRPLDEMK
jgi:hypothetical protein